MVVQGLEQMAANKRPKPKKISAKRKPTGKKTKPRKKPKKHVRFTPKRQEKFLSVLMATGFVNKAIEATGCSIASVYAKKVESVEFKEAWTTAQQTAAEMVFEPEMFRRAIEGVEDWKTVGGVPVRVRKYSDNLLSMTLKGAMPEKYRENVHNEHSVDINLAGARERITAELAKFGIERPENKSPVS